MSDFEYNVNLGKLGEEELSRWCTSAGLIANRSLEEDTMGWDHLVEFPYIKSDAPQDKQEKPIECKIQLKSTQRTDKSVNIKLSALKRLVDYTSPAFILFYEYDNSISPVLEHSYLVHVDEKLITRILKKIRQNHLLKTPKKLNKIELKVSYGKNNKLRENTGEVLRDEIVNFTPDGIAKYQQDKDKLTKTVGYENGGYQLHFKTSGKELEDYFMNKALGLATSLDIKDALIQDTRFKLNGINIKESDEAEIEVSPKIHSKCKLRFKTSIYSSSISFDAELVQVPSVLTEYNRLLFKSNLFSIELGIMTKDSFENIKLHETLDKKVSIEECIRFFKVFSPSNSGKPLFLELDFGIENGSMSYQCDIKHNHGDFSDLVNNLQFLKNKFDIDSSLEVHMEQLIQDENRIQALCKLLQNDVDSLQLRAKDTPEKKLEEIKQPVSFIVVLGSSAFGAITLVFARNTEDFIYQAYKVEILDTLSFNDHIPTNEQINKLENQSIKRYIDEHN
ncbi:hypothetical protein [Photobacterium iliopiscarium]|nr:hypothetical protein [Photobacterium iliopiscarium]PSU01657.1 hypothetical protein C9I85_00280 [Photobacterium iliopiscarium]PSV83407.1 hypothetical protein C9J51_08885 [Photobacterium iliopiscarium]